jgi:putative transposase
MTPHSVHNWLSEQLRSVRQAGLNEAFLATPNRFKGSTQNPSRCPPQTINPTSPQRCTANS